MFQRIYTYLGNTKAKIQYNDYYRPSSQVLSLILEHYKAADKRVAIWGYGEKAKSFLDLINKHQGYITCIIDMDSNLHGMKVPDQLNIISYNEISNYDIEVILVMNKVFYVDVHNLIQSMGLTKQITLIDLDELVENKVSLKQYLSDEYEVKNNITIDTAKIKDSLMPALKEVNRICKKYKIPYFLAAGSALGAVRHKGFIPWDYDVDIGLLRKDYERLKKVLKKELKEPFYYQTITKDKDYYRANDQIIVNHTAFVKAEHINAKFHHGFSIDIFPFDFVSENEELRDEQFVKVNKYRGLLKAKLLKTPYHSRNVFKKVIVNYEYYLLKLIPLNFLIRDLKDTLTMYKKIDTGIVADLCSHNMNHISFNKSDIFPVKYMEFEGGLYPVPNNIDVYLEKMYGNYMVLPPENQRVQKFRMLEISYQSNYSLDDEWFLD